MDFESIRLQTELELGSAIEKVFATFEKEPVAAASLGRHCVILCRLSCERKAPVLIEKIESKSPAIWLDFLILYRFFFRAFNGSVDQAAKDEEHFFACGAAVLQKTGRKNGFHAFSQFLPGSLHVLQRLRWKFFAHLFSFFFVRGSLLIRLCYSTAGFYGPGVMTG